MAAEVNGQTASGAVMGHGFVTYRGGIMLNCHEGISSYVGDRLAELASRAEYLPIAPAVSVWNEPLEMPPGCSGIERHLHLAEITPEL
jgi:hypothetical protein